MQEVAPDISLADFARLHRPTAAPPSNRVLASLLTAALSALLVLLAMQKSLWTMPDQPASHEIMTLLMRDEPHKEAALPPPPFVTIRLRLHAEKPAPPVFTVASETPPAPAALPASAAQASPLAGGIVEGTGTGAQSVSANGTNGNGKGLSACWDAAWGQAVHDRIGRFFFYPTLARMHHMTGTVMVHMLVRHDGRLDLLEILKSSGHSTLDNAAYDMVRKAQPLPARPDRMHADRIDAEMPISFGDMGNFTPTPGNCGA